MKRDSLVSNVAKLVGGIHSLLTIDKAKIMQTYSSNLDCTNSVDASVMECITKAEESLLVAYGVNRYGGLSQKRSRCGYIVNVTTDEAYKTIVQAARQCNVRRQRVHICLTIGGVITPRKRPMLLGFVNDDDQIVRIPYNMYTQICLPMDTYHVFKDKITGCTSAAAVAVALARATGKLSKVV